MAQGTTGLGNSYATDGVFEARIDRTSSTVLTLSRYKGKRIEINGSLVVLTSSGLALTIGAGGSDTITSTGANSGSKTTTSTLYYVYVSSDKASPNPSSLRVSTTAYTDYNGVRYLGTSGNAAEWRFVGWLRTDGSGNIHDNSTDPSKLFVVNYYNRLVKRLFTCPAYADGNTTTTWTANSTSWAAANAGTGNKLEFIDNGEDITIVSAQLGQQGVASQFTSVGIDVNASGTATSPQRCMSGAAGQYNNNVVNYRVAASEGYRTINLSYRTTSVASYTIEADEARNGASADPAKTYIEAEVMA